MLETKGESSMVLGWRVYGFGVMALGLASLAFRQWDPGQPIPQHFPARSGLSIVAGLFIVFAAVAVEWRRIAAWGAMALTVYYAVFVVILMNGRLLLTDFAEYVTYENIAMQLVIAAGGLIVYAGTARIDAATTSRLIRCGQVTFGVCTLVFGGAHFAYVTITASMVPKWLPPTQAFWAYTTGVAFLAAGSAILTGVQARLAGILVTAMLASFGLLVNGRILLADHSSYWNWSESTINLAVTGAAWVVADSLALPRHWIGGSTSRPR